MGQQTAEIRHKSPLFPGDVFPIRLLDEIRRKAPKWRPFLDKRILGKLSGFLRQFVFNLGKTHQPQAECLTSLASPGVIGLSSSRRSAANSPATNAGR